MFGLDLEHTKPYVNAVVGRAPRKRVPERTRDALIDAAAALFVEQGLDAPSLDAICERAGYTRGAFYVHFATRDELVGAVIERAMKQFLDAIVGEQGEPDLLEIVEAFLRALSEGRLPISERVRASQVLEACARSWELRVKYLAVLVTARERIASAARRSQASGTIRADVSADALAEMLLAMVIGVQIAAQLEAPYDARAAATQLRTMLAPAAPPTAARAAAAAPATRPRAPSKKRR